MTDSFDARRAIESLRAGVPNHSAVSALGGKHGPILESFEADCLRLLGAAKQTPSARGFFIEGNFGTGKSHQLRFLETIAHERRIPCSTVVISKETPLGDLGAVYRSAISGLRFGDATLAGTLATVFEKLSRDARALSALCRSVSEPSARLDPVFLASLQLLRRYRTESEIFEQLCDFWDGGQPQIVTWKRLLKDVDTDRAPIRAVRISELAPQRFRFATLALLAVGYMGWFIALDEVELIASFGLRARAKAYESVSFLFDNASNDDADRWFVVAAITEDLTQELFKKRGDLAAVKDRFRFDSDFVAKAVAGTLVMQEKGRTFRLTEPTALDLTRSYESVRGLYSLAYGIDAISVFSGKGALARSKSMRSYVREWIGYWDLKMQDNAYEPQIRSRETKFTLAEDVDLEAV